MATNDTTTRLSITPREPSSSRETRRLRRAGQVPGVIYGGEGEPLPFSVDAVVLRRALARSGAVVELEIDGSSTPAVLKDTQRHPVRGETLHVDFLRVRLDRPIHATVPLELVGAESAPGVREGGVLDQVVREVTVEALPNMIPDAIRHDVSGLEAGATEHLSAVVMPEGVTLVTDPEVVIASLTMPTIDTEAEEAAEGEIEQETEVVGEGAESAEGGADGGDAGAGDEQGE
jgi:large subunit ribosomal protein L25